MSHCIVKQAIYININIVTYIYIYLICIYLYGVILFLDSYLLNSVVSSIHNILVNLLYKQNNKKKHYLYHDTQTQLHFVI